MKKYHVTGTCHIDLAWHGDEEQYAAYLEQFTLILLDMLERYPDMTYTIEQAYHYRKLQQNRPDLMEKLARFIGEGRIEVVGGMISTIETNIPCGESFVRNQLTGLRWFEENLNAKVTTGWLVDTFGTNAQVPQIFTSFGFREMMASRFGANKLHDVFYARGLDGTKLLVAGRDCFSLNQAAPEKSRVFLDFIIHGHELDALCERARQAKKDGPILLDYYIEDEIYPTRRMIDRTRELIAGAKEGGYAAAFSLPRDFFRELHALDETFPTENGDFNPEFTGTYAQRIDLRLNNRRTEVALLDAEKWQMLLDQPVDARLHEAWWDMGFVQFHDVFTGSHPHKVFLRTMARLDDTRRLANGVMEDLFGPENSSAKALRVVNGLPFARQEWVSVPCEAPCTVRRTGEAVPSYLSDGRLYFLATADACAASIYTLHAEESAACATSEPAESSTLENDHIRLTVSAEDGVTLTHKSTGRTLLDEIKDLLVLQEDDGNFQIEHITTGERYAWASPVRVERTDAHAVTARGYFEGNADWQLTFTLHPEDRMVNLDVRINWQAEGKRLRLKLPTTLENAGDGIYEIPFGVVRRRAYTPSFCRKGEWPAQRFVAVEDATGGLALINNGVPGVEILGGTVYTTLLRAPTESYSGMIPDESSSQHGEHAFRFALLPYAGTWQQADVLRAAQGFNEPLRLFSAVDAQELPSRLCVSSPTVLLSTVKQPEDASCTSMILRLTESAGTEETCTVTIPGAVRAYALNLREEVLEELPIADGAISLTFAPFQIQTIYVEKAVQHG